MRELTDRGRIAEFMSAVGRVARSPARVYLTGGSTAVLFGWRESTIDIDIRVEPELDEIFRALPDVKERLKLNVELASPPDFIPAVPGWEERSIFIDRDGKVDFFHFDPYSQALSKIQRRHKQDLDDVESMYRDDLVQPQRLLEFFARIKPLLYKYPAIDPADFERAVIEWTKGHNKKEAE